MQTLILIINIVNYICIVKKKLNDEKQGNPGKKDA